MAIKIDLSTNAPHRLNDKYATTNNGVRKNQKWRKLMTKMVKESKRSIFGSSKASVLLYDAVSYLQNFDDGNHHDECYPYGR